MSRVIQERLGNGKAVQLYLLPAGEGLTVATGLFKTFAPSVGSLIASLQEGGEIDYMTLAFSIVEGLDNFDVNRLVNRLLKDIAIDGQGIVFDDYFTANYAELCEILALALKENFGSFLELRGFVERFLPLPKQEQTEAE